MKLKNINRALFLGLIAICFGSCQTTRKTPLEYYKSGLAIDISQINSTYTYPSIDLFQPKNNTAIDGFDENFQKALYQIIETRQYVVDKPGSLQTLYLKNCLVSLDPTERKGDSVYRALVVCDMSGVNQTMFYEEASIPKLSVAMGKLEMNQLSFELAKKSAIKFDSLHSQALRRKDPIKYGTVIEEKKLHPFIKNTFLGFLILALILIGGAE